MNIQLVLLADSDRRKCISIIPFLKQTNHSRFIPIIFVKSSESHMFSQGLLSGVETLSLESFPVIFCNELEHMYNCIAAIKQTVDVWNMIM